MSKQFWKWSDIASTQGSELILDGPISDLTWWGDEVTPEAFREELAKHQGDLTVVLNSPGGDVFAGLSIYNALREHQGNITIRVDGLAASIASIIAMAGDKIIMSPGSMMMIHRPSVMAMGNVDDMEEAIKVLVGIEESIAPIYAERTGLSEDKIQELLAGEGTWFTADEAVSLGFADEVASAKKKVELPEPAEAFSGKLAFSMSATKKTIEDLVTKVKNEEVDQEVEEEVAVPDEVTVVEEAVVVETEGDKAETPVVDESEETTEETETDEEEEEEMSKVEEIAQDQILPEAQAQTDAPKMELKSYINSKKSVEDFAMVLGQNAGKSAQEVKDAWASHLSVTMGVTNPEVLLPQTVIRSIQDAFETGGEIWNLVNKTGLTVFRTALNTVTGEDSRAKGWDRELQSGFKTEQRIEIADRTIRAQFIYKYITLNKEDIRDNADTGALVSYVLSELPKRIVNELERAIVIGDGRAPGSLFEITSFTSIVEDAVADDGYAQVYTPEGGDNFLQSILKADALVKADGSRYLVTSRTKLVDMKLTETNGGNPYFAFGADLASALGFAGIITPDWFDEATVDAVIFVPSAYATVGDSSIEAFTNFILKENKQEYLQEVYAGGALSRADSAVTIASVS